jgi:hypothetical protein
VVYPIAPLYDLRTNELTPKFTAVVARLFRFFDQDCDGVLSAQELNFFQVGRVSLAPARRRWGEGRDVSFVDVPFGIRCARSTMCADDDR